MKFLRNFAASLLAIAVFFGFGFVFFLIIVFSMEDTQEFQVVDNTVLKINFTEPMADRDFVEPLQSFDFLGNSTNRLGIIDLRKALQQAATDDRIKGVVLYAPGMQGGFALGQEARRAIKEFKESGKLVWAYAELMTEGGYYLSSVADKVFISPEGALEWNGLSAEVTFFKNALDKLGIDAQVFRVGEYKSAVEPFMLDHMSAKSREQMDLMLNSIYGTMLNEIAADKEITAAKLKELSDGMTIQTLEEAKQAGLITDMVYRDELNEMLAEEIGVESAEKINWASYRQYNSSFNNYSKSKNKIAVIIAEGDILSAPEQKGLITPTQFVKELKRARKDDNVKAVVFRVNSPGGDALASDLIWHEVKKTAEVKPVVASMSNYAASGGYYISMAADTIVAEANTITGSIGIFGVIFNIGDFMSDKLGITTDRVKTGDYSDIMTSSRKLSDAERAIIQRGVDNGYESFTTKAAEGRGMTQDAIKAIASGRVWTGSQALENGLVDILGGLETAIDVAAEMADITDDYKLRYYPVQKTSLEELMDRLAGNTNAAMLKARIGALYPYLEMVQHLENTRGIQARLPFDVEIR